MVGQFGREFAMRELVGINAGLDQGPCLFPDRIVAGHEDNAAPHQRRYGIVFSGEGSRRILIVRGIGRRCLLLDDQRIGPEPAARQLGEAILVPRRLIVEREKRRTMSHGHREEIRMFERPDLRMKFSQGPAMSVLSQTCLGTGLYERTSVKASSSHCSRRSKIIGTVLKSRRRGACARRFFSASRCVAPGGVKAGSTAAAAGLAVADATPIALVATVRANVFSARLLAATMFIAASRLLRSG